jgi:glutaconate CoA-transferase subunit B
LIGVGKDYKHLQFRGPGAVGTLSMAHYVDRYYLFVQSHDKRIFVDKCDFISTVGWGEGGADGRKRLGIPGSGPVYCITPLCIFDFDESSKRMRLKSVHPGVSVEQVIENTGFEVVVPKAVATTPAPTEEEIRTLRERIDVEGMLRQ